jgi:uncharacterized protein
MKFQPETLNGGFVVHAYDDTGIVLNGQRYAHSLMFGESLPPIQWHSSASNGLSVADAQWILAQCPPSMEVLLLGTGPTQVFPALDIRRFFINQRCPIEYMDSQAAARTYNILMGEGRHVVAALLL